MSRRAIFVDTSAWYALQVTDDEFHPATAAVFPKILDRYETLVTSNHVVGETYTLLRTARGFRDRRRFQMPVPSTLTSSEQV
ncbi:MAG: PIN domain-containing protein, partial [Candidatus Methylomirabilia bacterium]